MKLRHAAFFCILSVSQSFAFQFQQPSNLFKMNYDSIKAEESIHYTLRKDKSYLLVKSTGAPEKTPSIYLGKVAVQSGKTYTFAVKGRSGLRNGASLYVTSPQGNIVWPGNKLIDGIVKNTFTVPGGVSGVTIGVVMMYPVAEEYLVVEDIAFYAGDVDAEKALAGSATTALHGINDPKAFGSEKNLFFLDTTALRADSGVFYKTGFDQSRPYLVARSAANKKGTPAIYLGKVSVKPGEIYSYIIKGSTSRSKGMALYVTSQNGDLLWPGSHLEMGFTKNTFTVPEDIKEVVLGIGFLFPVGKECLLVEDVGLFKGDVDPVMYWDSPDEKGSLVSAFSSKYLGANWRTFVFIVLLAFPVVLHFIYKKNLLKIPS